MTQKPHLRFSSLGEIAIFTIEVTVDNHKWYLLGQENGQLKVVSELDTPQASYG